MAMQQMAHAEGECGVARACRAEGTNMLVSTMANAPLEDVAATAGGSHLWFQLYVFRCGPSLRGTQCLGGRTAGRWAHGRAWPGVCVSPLVAVQGEPPTLSGGLLTPGHERK